MKRFPCVLISIFAFFFLILPVNADTINITLPEGWVDIVEDELPVMQSNISSYISSWPDLVSGDYFIYCNYNFSKCFIRYVRKAYSNQLSSFYYSGWYDNSNWITVLWTSRTYSISQYIQPTTWELNSCSATDCKDNVKSFYSYGSQTTEILYPLYSTFTLNGDSSITANSYVFSYGSWSYTSNSIPTLYELYQDYNSTPPPPTDDFPLLTSFYTTCLNSFSIVVEEFTTNYIYLAIVTIFLLITIIYLLKRRFS